MPAAMMAIPAVLVAVWIAVFELTLEPPNTTPPSGSTLAGAVREDEIMRAYAHIRSGENPNTPVLFTDERTTGGRELLVTPLLIAVAHDREDSVAMLLSSGVRMDAPGNRYASCLARQLGLDELSDQISRVAGAQGVQADCPDIPHSDEAPLAPFSVAAGR